LLYLDVFSLTATVSAVCTSRPNRFLKLLERAVSY